MERNELDTLLLHSSVGRASTRSHGITCQEVQVDLTKVEDNNFDGAVITEALLFFFDRFVAL